MLNYTKKNIIDIATENINNQKIISDYIYNIDENSEYFIVSNESKVISIISIKHLKWDSNIFNKKIGLLNLCFGNLEKDSYIQVMNKVDKYCKAERFECIFTKVSTDDYSTMHILENLGYNLMDSIVTFKRKLNIEDKLYNNDKYTITLLDESDIEEVVSIIDNLYSYGRFFEDDNLDNDRANELYKQWITNEVRNSNIDVIGIKENDKLIGFTSCKYQLNEHSELEGVISLVGIVKSYQGLGIGKILMNSVLNNFKNKNIDLVYVGTQINNIPAINFYISNGFRMTSSVNSLHKWINRD